MSQTLTGRDTAVDKTKFSVLIKLTKTNEIQCVENTSKMAPGDHHTLVTVVLAVTLSIRQFLALTGAHKNMIWYWLPSGAALNWNYLPEPQFPHL